MNGWSEGGSMESRNIGVVGLGKLGICLAVLFSKHFRVFGVDVSKERIKQITGHEKIYEPKVNEYLERYGKNLVASTSYDVLADCDVVFIITQTPSLPSGKFDVQYVSSALSELHKVNPDCLTVISSTTNIGDVDKLKSIHQRIAYNPEFIKQGSIVNDFENPRFVVIGAYEKNDGEKTATIWKQIHNKPIYLVKPIEAEIIKLALNVSYTLGITFANIIGEFCEKFNADPNSVLEVVYQDRRDYKPGLGYAGPCFPRDVGVFMATSLEESIVDAYKFGSLLRELNDHVVEKYLVRTRKLNKRRIGILGVAYKPNVPYIYESQALMIAQRLLDEDYDVYIYDRLAEKDAKQALRGSKARFCSSVEECINLSEVIFIGTPNYSNVKANKPIVNPWK
jgi:nucleotide sugar dehydrogenase